MDIENAKNLGREKLQLAISNLKQAEVEGAETLAPNTYHWAKHKIYEDKKNILKNFEDEELIEEASDDACAAAAQLLSVVRRQKHSAQSGAQNKVNDAINNLENEGGRDI